MKFKLNSLAAFVATLAMASSANAALAIYQPWDDFFLPARGLDGVLFNTQTATVTDTVTGAASTATVAMGAHAFKNGVYLPNNGVDTYYANTGLYEANRANWSFDFAYDLTSCNQCTVWLGIDKDSSASVNYVWRDVSTVIDPESWNMEMSFITTDVYDFNPYSASSTGFRLEVRDGSGSGPRLSGNLVVGSDITVNVPEPGSLALAGLALCGLTWVSRRRGK